jgi:hypothetical protein
LAEFTGKFEKEYKGSEVIVSVKKVEREKLIARFPIE